MCMNHCTRSTTTKIIVFLTTLQQEQRRQRRPARRRHRSDNGNDSDALSSSSSSSSSSSHVIVPADGDDDESSTILNEIDEIIAGIRAAALARASPIDSLSYDARLEYVSNVLIVKRILPEDTYNALMGVVGGKNSYSNNSVVESSNGGGNGTSTKKRKQLLHDHQDYVLLSNLQLGDGNHKNIDGENKDNDIVDSYHQPIPHDSNNNNRDDSGDSDHHIKK